MGSQIIGWAKNDPIYDSFHGISENIVSHCKGTTEITHIMKICPLKLKCIAVKWPTLLSVREPHDHRATARSRR